MFLKGATYGEMATATGMDKHTVWDHVRDHVQPRLANSEHCNLEDDLRRTKDLEEAALEAFTLSCKPEFKGPRDTRLLELAKWAIEHRAKIFGHYAPTKVKDVTQDDVRIAGKSPSELDEEVVADIFRAINEKRLAQLALKN